MSERKETKKGSLSPERLPKPGFRGYSNEKKWETVNKIMKDAFDCHINMGQDFTGYGDGPVDRPYDDLTICMEASKAGMKGIVFTCHVGPSFFRVPLIQKTINEWADQCNIRPVKVIGSVTLNYPMGGLNPEVVRMLVRFGGKIVLMPTIDGWHSMHIRKLTGGIELVKNGKIVPPLEEIIGIMADNNLVMDISHVEAQQRFILLDEGKKAGIKGFYVFNPMPDGIIGATDDQWAEYTKKGLKLMIAGNVLYQALWGGISGDRFSHAWNLIKKVGIENCISGTDLNWWPGTHPVEGLRVFAAKLLMDGLSESDLEKMYQINPATLLDI